MQAENICAGLSLEYPEYAALFEENLGLLLTDLKKLEDYGTAQLSGLRRREILTFHDGFAYFADTFDLPLLASIEEEAGSEASAKEIVRITELVREHELPAIFTEVNGSDATARAISRETGCGVYTLSTIMDGREPFADDISPIMPYIEAININVAAIVGAFSPEEVE